MRSSPRSGSWLDAIMRVMGFSPRELRANNDDRPRRDHRYVPLAGDGGDGLGGGPGRHRAHRARRTEDPDEQWVRDTHPRFG